MSAVSPTPVNASAARALALAPVPTLFFSSSLFFFPPRRFQGPYSQNHIPHSHAQRAPPPLTRSGPPNTSRILEEDPGGGTLDLQSRTAGRPSVRPLLLFFFDPFLVFFILFAPAPSPTHSPTSCEGVRSRRRSSLRAGPTLNFHLARAHLVAAPEKFPLP